MSLSVELVYISSPLLLTTLKVFSPYANAVDKGMQILNGAFPVIFILVSYLYSMVTAPWACLTWTFPTISITTWSEDIRNHRYGFTKYSCCCRRKNDRKRIISTKIYHHRRCISLDRCTKRKIQVSKLFDQSKYSQAGKRFAEQENDCSFHCVIFVYKAV